MLRFGNQAKSSKHTQNNDFQDPKWRFFPCHRGISDEWWHCLLIFWWTRFSRPRHSRHALSLFSSNQTWGEHPPVANFHHTLREFPEDLVRKFWGREKFKWNSDVIQCFCWYKLSIIMNVVPTTLSLSWLLCLLHRILGLLSKNQNKKTHGFGGFFQVQCCWSLFLFTTNTSKLQQQKKQQHSACRRMGSGMIGMRTNRAGRVSILPSWLVRIKWISPGLANKWAVTKTLIVCCI